MWNNGNDCGCLWIILIIILLCCCCGNGGMMNRCGCDCDRRMGCRNDCNDCC